jgi:RNA polymerase sigma-70 factor (ECF subfamily)
VTATAQQLEQLRSGLLAFCYQMLGSPFDAEDAVQDAMERAWRARDSYDADRGALSTWMFRIAKNVCIDRLREAPRRPLPRDLSDPGIDVGAPLVPALDVPWLMPAPTSWWDASGPEHAAVASERMRLAVTAMLQAMPARQRGVFILRDVLAHSAAETAVILDMSVAAVNSALQRARVALGDSPTRTATLRRDTVEGYARAIERADVAALAALVSDDVLFEMPPVPRWSIGRSTYADFMAFLFEWRGTRWRTRAISANGQAGILLYEVHDDGAHPHTVQLFDGSAPDVIGHVLVYQNPQLFTLFEAGR